MIPVPGVTITGSNLRVGITIPAAGQNLRKILEAANPNHSVPIIAVMILGRLPNSTDRGAFMVADPRPGAEITETDYTVHGEPVFAGESYTSPSVGDLDSYFRAAVDTQAVAVLFW